MSNNPVIQTALFLAGMVWSYVGVLALILALVILNLHSWDAPFWRVGWALLIGAEIPLVISALAITYLPVLQSDAETAYSLFGAMEKLNDGVAQPKVDRTELGALGELQPAGGLQSLDSPLHRVWANAGQGAELVVSALALAAPAALLLPAGMLPSDERYRFAAPLRAGWPLRHGRGQGFGLYRCAKIAGYSVNGSSQCQDGICRLGLGPESGDVGKFKAAGGWVGGCRRSHHPFLHGKIHPHA